MRRLSFALVFTLLSFYSFSQKDSKINYHANCPAYNYCNDCGDQKAVFLGKLKKYFEKEINFRDMDMVNGVIVMKIAVDSTGKACPSQFYNLTGNSAQEITRLRLNEVIERMPLWEPGTQNGMPVNSYVWLAVYSHIEGHGIFDASYMRSEDEKRWYIVNSNNEHVLVYFDETEEKNAEP